MSSIGPQLPPQATKRQRDDSDESPEPSNKHARREGSLQNHDEIDLNASGSDSEDDYAPPRPSSIPAPAAPTRSVGPSLPPHLAANNNQDEINLSASDSDTGPAPPPGASPDRDSDSSDDDDDDDDDFGPSLPSASAPRRQIGPSLPATLDDDAPKRDDWMLAPPPSSSTFSERDTTKLRARKFSSKPKPSSSTAPGAPSIWTETPEEKLRRLQDSVLGRTPSTADGQSAASEAQLRKARRDEALAAEMHANRGKSLLEEHQEGKRAARGGKRPGEEDEDDPSKRAFDREKDMAIGGRITATQRRELINKSANFGGRFQKGSFL